MHLGGSHSSCPLLHLCKVLHRISSDGNSKVALSAATARSPSQLTAVIVHMQLKPMFVHHDGGMIIVSGAHVRPRVNFQELTQCH